MVVTVVAINAIVMVVSFVIVPLVRVIVVVATMVVAMPAAMVMRVAKQRRRYQVHDEPHGRDRERLVIVLDRVVSDDPGHTLVAHPQRDQREQETARVTGERIHLARPEAERIVGSARAGVPVGDQRQAERADVGAHVPAVGRERHRSRHAADDQLGDHHHRGQPDDQTRASLPQRLCSASSS